MTPPRDPIGRRAPDRRLQASLELKFLSTAGVAAVFAIEASYLFVVPPWTYLTNMRLVNANQPGTGLNSITRFRCQSSFLSRNIWGSGSR